LENSELGIIEAPPSALIDLCIILTFKNGQCTCIPVGFFAITKINQPYLSADSDATAGGNRGGERSLHLDY